jgi:lactoylglutathione lyase
MASGSGDKPNSGPRPFRVLGVQQIAVGAATKAPLRRLWLDLLGLTPVGEFRSEQENVDEDILAIGGGPLRVEVDLMEPVDPEGRPRVHEPPLNHIGLWIDDLRAAVTWLKGQGVRFTPGGIRKGASGYDVCFVHPKGSEDSPVGGAGVLIELVQAPPEVVTAFDRMARK